MRYATIQKQLSLEWIQLNAFYFHLQSHEEQACREKWPNHNINLNFGQTENSHNFQMIYYF